ncbi:MAG: hypothetical protein H6719_25060 [Sandaracinaceae bacterium]|nr:hypothetical protein [Sandaracinaceae bacterium]
MTRAALLALALTTLAPALASAQTSTTFSAPVAYRQCSQTWAFACGMRDAQGRGYGTATPMTMCTTYRFAVDGTLAVEAMAGISDPARYRIDGDQVLIEWLDDEGHVRHTQTLRLADDGSTLGELHRLDPEPPPSPPPSR